MIQLIDTWYLILGHHLICLLLDSQQDLIEVWLDVHPKMWISKLEGFEKSDPLVICCVAIEHGHF